MVCCAVAGCINSCRLQKKLNFIWHRFPKDNETRQKWINTCRRADSFSVDSARICSVHFDDSDYLRDLKSELLNLPPKRVLKPSSVPHLNLPVVSATTTVEKPSDDRKVRVQKRNNRKDVLEILQVSPNSIEDAFVKDPEVSKIDVNVIKSCNCDVEGLLKKLETFGKENETLKREILDLNERLAEMNKDLVKIKNLKHLLEGKFSESQQQLVTKGRCSNWSSDDVAKAATLRCISYKALGFVRDVLRYPLPSEMTIRRRLKQFTVPPGFVDISTNILKSQAGLLTNFEKDLILSFDEMKVNSDLCFDQVQEIFRGPHNYVQVMLVRPLVGKWMQPIYYNFDSAVSKDLLMETIHVIENTGFKLRGFVSDMGPCNRKLLNVLNVSYEKSFITNPADESRKVWVFCDVPHALKLLRNHLLDDGYILKSGQIFNKEVFIKLVELQSTGEDLQYAHKISMNHLLVAGPERQNVRKAAELLSLTVGKAITYNFPEFSHVGEAVITVNNGFDVLNSRIPTDGIFNLKSAYGNCLNEQNHALDNLYELILSMKVDKNKQKETEKNEKLLQSQCQVIAKTKNNRSTLKAVKGQKPTDQQLLPFQKGFLMSINSLRGLFTDLQSEGYTYVMAARCNQDIIESYFSKIRGLGRFYDHPLPTTVSQRIKTLILSRNASEVITGSNCLVEKGCESLSANVFANCSDQDCQSQKPTQHEKVEQENLEDKVDNDSEDEELTLAIDGLLKHLEEEQESRVTEKSELLEMLAGYIAYRMRKKYPGKANLYGDFTKNVSCTVKNWLQAISRGSLMKPTDLCMQSVLQMEEEFKRFHGTLLNKEVHVFKTLKNKIKNKYPEMDDFMVMCFVRTRSFIRMKSLNKRSSKKWRGSKRDDSNERKKVKKMKKVVN